MAWTDPGAWDALQWAVPHYGVTAAQAQKIGATLMVFLAGVDAGRRGIPR